MKAMPDGKDLDKLFLPISHYSLLHSIPTHHLDCTASIKLPLERSGIVTRESYS